MSFPTEKEAREFLRNNGNLDELFPSAATKIYVIDGIIFSFMLERGLSFVVASDIALLSPRLKLDQSTTLVNATKLYYNKKNMARFIASVRGLDADVPNALKRVCYSEEYDHEIKQVANECFDAMQRWAVGGDWARDEVVAALTAEVDEYWEIEEKKRRAAQPAGFSRDFKFELQEIFDAEDRAWEEEQLEKQREAERRAAVLYRQQMEWMQLMEAELREEQRRMLELQQQDRVQGGQHGMGFGG